MNKYCMVNVIKEECIKEYVHMHKNAWKEVVTELRRAGARDERIYMFNNIAVIFVECENINDFVKKFGDTEVGAEWYKTVAPLFKESQSIAEDGNAKDKVDTLEMVFDLNADSNIGSN